MTSRNRPVVLFGIDGATYSILDPMLVQGQLPNLARLKQKGAWGVLQSNIHPLTPAAWVSMVTGLNPGKHGVYDFRRRKAASYDWELVNSRSWDGDPVWSILGQQGKKVGIFNVPMTYPPHPVNGFMVTGLGTPPNSQNFIYPNSLATKFQEHFSTYTVEPDAATNDLNDYLLHNHRSLEQRIEALRFIWNEYADLDFFMPVFIETDRVHHVYWRFMDPNMPDHSKPSAAKIREQVSVIYQKIDAVLGELWAWVADRQGYMLVVSDHGFGPLLKDVYINKWLVDQGYLTLKLDTTSSSEGHFFDQVDWDNTRAYSFGYFGNINLNLRGREPRGIVEPGRDAETLKQEMISRLRQITDPETDEVIVDAIFRKEELYSGTFLDQAPDFLVIMKNYAYMTRDGFDFNGKRLVGPPMEHNKDALPHSGNHRLEGIVFMAGEGIKPGSKIHGAGITDIAPTVLYLAGSPVPDGLDGQVLLSAFDEAFVANQPPAYTLPITNGARPDKPLKVQLLEKDVQISLLDDEVRRLRRVIAEKDRTINDLADLIQRFKNGRAMRFLTLLHSAKLRWFNRDPDS
jgi:predicted AlkP superfamily phosphohydrolase/phosphomutase